MGVITPPRTDLLFCARVFGDCDERQAAPPMWSHGQLFLTWKSNPGRHFLGFLRWLQPFFIVRVSSSSKRNPPYFSQWFFTTSRVPTSQNSPQQKKNKRKKNKRRKQKREGKAIIQRQIAHTVDGSEIWREIPTVWMVQKNPVNNGIN